MSKINLEVGNMGIFDKFYIPHLEFIKKQVEDCINKHRDVVNAKRVLHDVMVQSKAALIEISCKTLIEDFQETIGLNKIEKDSYKVYENNLIQQEEQDRIFRKYPVMKFLIDNRRTTIVKLICEIISRYSKDRNSISRMICKNCGIIDSISINCGDTHNHGKCVAIIDVSVGDKIVYKPRSLAIDLAYEKIAQWLYKKGALQIMTAKSCEYKEYGWQEFIESKCCNDRDEVVRYCTRLGILLAIFRCLGTSDIHAENIIPCREYPVIIDLETLVTNYNIDTSDGSISSAIKEFYSKSVLGSCFLPNRNSYLNMDIDVSGLGGQGGQQSAKLKYHTVENRGTSNIQIVEKYVETVEKNNILLSKGEKINYLDYLEEIQNGFSSAYNIIFDNKMEFQELLDKCLNEVCFRQVLRGTFIYDKFLKASYHPSYQRSFNERNRVLSILKKGDSEWEKAETVQMMRDDIPYFFSKYNDYHLWQGEGICQKNFFPHTTRDEIYRTLNLLGNEDLKSQARLIVNSFMSSKENINIDDGKNDKFISKTSNEMDIVKEIMDYLINRAIWNYQKNKCVLMDLDFSAEHPFINVETEGLYSAVGTIIFSFLVAKETKVEKYADFSKALLKGYEELYEINKSNISTSVFSGFASKIYLYFFLYQLTGEPLYYVKYITCLDMIYDYKDYGNELKKDLIGGITGCIIMMANIYIIEKNNKLETCINKFSEKLYLYSKEQGGLWTGFAHGLSGYALALFKSGKLFNNEKYCQQALQLIQEENRYYIDTLYNWKDLRNKEINGEWFWCHGAPGILMARMYMLGLTNDPLERNIIEKNYNTSLQCFQNNLELKSQSLCHGAFGNFVIAKFLAKATENEELDKRAEEIYTRIIQKISNDGMVYGIPGVIGLTSFMLGMSGIGYGILMHKYSQYPNLLGLEMIMR